MLEKMPALFICAYLSSYIRPISLQRIYCSRTQNYSLMLHWCSFHRLRTSKRRTTRQRVLSKDIICLDTDQLHCYYIAFHSNNLTNLDKKLQVESNGSYIRLSAVSRSTTAQGYYQSVENDGTLRLVRQSSTAPPTNESFYCCQLSDALLSEHTLCASVGKLVL